MAFNKVGIICGGISSEREVSISTANAVSSALTKMQIEHILIDVKDLSFVEIIKKENVDVIFNGLHGSYGEDGKIQSILDFIRIPYTHSGVLASAIGMNKHFSKIIFADAGIKCIDGFQTTKKDLISGNITEKNKDILRENFVIKPVSDGSSCGVEIVVNNPNYDFSKYQAKSDNTELLVEKYIEGKELSVAVFDNKAIGVIELQPKSGFYDYKNKYEQGKTEHIYPANINKEIYDLAMEYAEKAHNAIGCNTVSRSDFRYDIKQNILYMLELNSQPGFTEISLLPEILNYNNIPFEKIILTLLKNAKHG